jgi:6,7-dimethyl-8-ribityllumazine synthase
MIKGITLVNAIASADRPNGVHGSEPGNEFDQLAGLFTSLGFEQGKGWQDKTGRGSSFLAPLGTLEFVTGRLPTVPPILVETTSLDSVHAAVHQWLLASHRTEEIATLLSVPELTHWNSRLFTVQLTQDLKIGFWQSENPLHNQPDAVEGDLSSVNMRFAIVTTRWNAVITDRLLQGSLDALHRSGTARTDIEIVRVPGAWEVPSAARTLAESKRFDAIITLGCLLRGETAHYEAIYNEVARGIGQSQQETGIPHAFGVLTCETLEQALDRAGLKAGNKGFEAAIAAIEMVSIQRKLAAGEETSTAAQEGKQ